MEEASRFNGHWEVDHAVSDSIEPMLKAMGVSLMIRKIAKSVKVTQEIRVKGDQFIVNNISKHAQDKTIHYMNAGARTILTNRGEKVIDTCTFDASREFPIEIEAVLPGDKGATVDKRKILPDGSAFVQHLIFRPPPIPTSSERAAPAESQEPPEEILMVRTFRKVNPPVSSSVATPQAEQQVEPEPAVAAESEAKAPSPKVEAEPQAALASTAAAAEVAESKPVEGREEALHRWMLVVTSAMAVNLILQLLHYEDELDGPLPVWLGLAASPGLLLRVFRFKLSSFFSTFLWIAYILLVLVATEKAIAESALPDTTRFSAWSFCAMLAFFCLLERVDAAGALSKGQWIFLTLITAAATAAPMLVDGRPGGKVGMGIASGLLVGYAGLRVVSLFAGKEKVAVEEAAEGEGEGASKGEADVEEWVEIELPEYRIVDGIYTQYKVNVKCWEGEWVVWRRYSQFHALRSDLRKYTGKGVLPQLPPKTLFLSTEESFVEQRRAQLEDFMQELVEMRQGEMLKRKLVRNFLGLGQGRGEKGEGGEATIGAQARKEKKKKDPNEDENVLNALKSCKLNMEKAFTCGDEDGWNFIGKKHGVQCYLKESNGLTFTKGVGVVDAPAEVILNYTTDMSTRKTYDDLHKKDTVLHVLDAHKIGNALNANVDLAEIRYSEFKSPFVVISPRDTVMASCRIRADNGVLTTLLVSVKGYKKPSSKYVRANVLGAGIKLDPVPGNPEKCIMTNVQCMDPNGAIPQWVVKAVAPERCVMSALLNKHVSKKEVWEKYGSPSASSSTQQ